MFKHEKMLFHPVGVERPNLQYAAFLQEQLGGGNGELKAAMQHMSQSFRIKDPEIKDLFLDIAAEEFAHQRGIWLQQQKRGGEAKRQLPLFIISVHSVLPQSLPSVQQLVFQGLQFLHPFHPRQVCM